MKKSMIYNLLDNELLHKWKEEIEETKNNCFFANAQEVFEELEKNLNGQEKELLKSYSLAIENKLDYIYYNLKIKILNLGIKIGMELEHSFAKLEELEPYIFAIMTTQKNAISVQIPIALKSLNDLKITFKFI